MATERSARVRPVRVAKAVAIVDRRPVGKAPVAAINIKDDVRPLILRENALKLFGLST